MLVQQDDQLTTSVEGHAFRHGITIIFCKQANVKMDRQGPSDAKLAFEDRMRWRA
jgi:hypothetical protein